MGHPRGLIAVVDDQRIHTAAGIHLKRTERRIVIPPHHVEALIGHQAVGRRGNDRRGGHIHGVELNTITAAAGHIKTAMHDIGLATGESKHVTGVEHVICTKITRHQRRVTLCETEGIGTEAAAHDVGARAAVDLVGYRCTGNLVIPGVTIDIRTSHCTNVHRTGIDDVVAAAADHRHSTGATNIPSSICHSTARRKHQPIRLRQSRAGGIGKSAARCRAPGDHITTNSIDQNSRSSTSRRLTYILGCYRTHDRVSASTKTSNHRTRRRGVDNLHHILPSRIRQRHTHHAVELRGNIAVAKAVHRHAVLEHHQAFGLTVGVAVERKADGTPGLRDVLRQVTQRIRFVGVGDQDRRIAGVIKADDAAGNQMLGDAVHRDACGQRGIRRDGARGQVQHIVISAASVGDIKRVDRVVTEYPAVIVAKQLHRISGTRALVEVNRICTESAFYRIGTATANNVVIRTTACKGVATTVRSDNYCRSCRTGADRIGAVAPHDNHRRTQNVRRRRQIPD